MAADVEFPFFRCEECGCEAFVIVGPVEDRAPVRCGACMTDVGAWAEFRAEIESRIHAFRLEQNRRSCPRPTLVRFDTAGSR
jgi:hypothetical protein